MARSSGAVSGDEPHAIASAAGTPETGTVGMPDDMARAGAGRRRGLRSGKRWAPRRLRGAVGSLEPQRVGKAAREALSPRAPHQDGG